MSGFPSPPNRPLPPSRFLELGDEDPVAKIIEAMKGEDDTDKDNAILCKQCDHIITHPDLAVTINDRFIHTFRNPSGLEFDIQCYSQADGALVSGSATDYYSWFPGYSWQICYCRQCHQHIGWYYSKGEDGFFGFNLASLKSDI